MPEEYEVVQTPHEDASTYTPEEAVTPKKTKKKKAKANRPVEECYTSDPKKMTDQERIAVIKFFQDSLDDVYRQFDDFKRNTEGAFEQSRLLKDQNERLKKEAQAKLSLMRQNINLLYQNTLMINMED